MVRRIPALLLFGIVAAAAGAQEDSGNPLSDELRAFSEEIAGQCKAVKEQLENFKIKRDPLTGYTLKDAVQSLCVCMPEKVQAFTSTLTAEDLARPVAAEEFLGRFNPAVIDTCAAEQMRAMYGEQCPERFRKAGRKAPRYCACMKDVVSRYSDATAAAIAAAASDYLPQAAEAEKNREPVPPRPLVLEEYHQADQRCKAD